MRHYKFLVLLVIFFSQQVFAMGHGGGGRNSGLNFIPSAMYLYDSTKDGSSTTQTSRLLADLQLGYIFSGSPFYIGGVYNYDSSTTSGSSTSKDLYTSYGAALGLVTDNVYMIFSYYVSSQYDKTRSTSTTSYTSGTGFSVALGYLFDLGSSLSIGPQIMYRDLKYTKTSTGATADITYDSVMPYVTLCFSF